MEVVLTIFKGLNNGIQLVNHMVYNWTVDVDRGSDILKFLMSIASRDNGISEFYHRNFGKKLGPFLLLKQLTLNYFFHAI